MARNPDRKTAKESISSRETSDPELEQAIHEAKTFGLEVTKEKNRHVEATHKANLGLFGQWFGGESSAPTYVAMLAMIVGLLGAGYSLWMASEAPTNAEFWGKQMERTVAFASAALAFIFGRGSSK